MGSQQNKGEKVYKKIRYTYSVYGENGVHGGRASIYLHFGDASEVIVLELNVSFVTLDEAEAAIIKSAQCRIDSIYADYQ